MRFNKWISILRNTPSRLLGEIILIDDCSKFRLNSTFLQAFHPKVRFKRNARRAGVIASRTLAASTIAQHKYLVFLDSHCEVNVGWLEPLVERLSSNPGTLVSPVVDVIDANSFEYRSSGGSEGLRVGFDWSLTQRWFPISEAEFKERGVGWNQTRPYA